MGRAPQAILLAVTALAAPIAQQGFDVGGVLLVTVTDARNQPIVDLDVDDFVVSQGNERREVLAVHLADYPLALLLDVRADAGNDLAARRAAAARFIARVGERAVAVLTITDPPTVIASFDDPRAVVLERIEGASASPASALAPLRALADAARLIRETETPFSAIVVVSGTSPEAAEAEPPGLLTAFFESRAILHVVTKNAPIAPGRPPLASGSESLLRELADRTGGRHTLIYSVASFQVALDQIADRLATEMMIEYLASPGDRDTREVKVGVTVPGARVRGLGVAR